MMGASYLLLNTQWIGPSAKSPELDEEIIGKFGYNNIVKEISVCKYINNFSHGTSTLGYSTVMGNFFEENEIIGWLPIKNVIM